MRAVIKIFQIEKFLRDFVLSSIRSLKISAFYMKVPYKPVPYRKWCSTIENMKYLHHHKTSQDKKGVAIGDCGQ